MRFFIFVFILLFLNPFLFPSPNKISSLPLPSDYVRVTYPDASFSSYLQKLSLKSENKIYSHKGEDLSHWYESLGVIDKPLLYKDDLEQCADFTMRLWADFHKETKLLSELYLFQYSGKKIYFKSSGKSFPQFLRNAFANSNSHSLKKGGKEIKVDELRPGDLFVQNENGGIGHVSIILDHAKSPAKEDLFLIGFSFMPAQEMHIEKSPSNRGKSGWFSYRGFMAHLAEKYPYGKPVLRRF